jgi:hypothetical protein
MPRVGFGPTTTVLDLEMKVNALDSAATVIGEVTFTTKNVLDKS